MVHFRNYRPPNGTLRASIAAAGARTSNRNLAVTQNTRTGSAAMTSFIPIFQHTLEGLGGRRDRSTCERSQQEVKITSYEWSPVNGSFLGLIPRQ